MANSVFNSLLLVNYDKRVVSSSISPVVIYTLSLLVLRALVLKNSGLSVDVFERSDYI